MKTLLFQLFFMSLRGGIAALLVLAANTLLRRLHAPARLPCVLWGIAALRFVLPGGIPFAVAKPQSPQLAQVVHAVQPYAAPPTLPVPAAVHAASPNITVTAPWYAGITLWHLLAAVWLLGSAVLLLRAAFAYARLARQVTLACKTVDGCYSCATVTTPFTLGILAPRIYMPAALQGTARRAVLLHERTHIRRRDTLTKPLVYLVACLHWWNPLAWLTFAQFERTMESACDEAAICAAGSGQRADYCQSILQFAQRRTAPGSLAFGQGSVKKRILHVLGYRRPTRAMLAACAAVALFAGTACMAKPTVTETAPTVSSGTAETTAATPAPTAQAPAATPTPTNLPAAGEVNFDPDTLICPLESIQSISRLMSNAHRGDDLVADKGTPVYAAAAGTVITADGSSSYGNCVVLDHGNDPSGNNWTTLYAHMDSITVELGQTVAQGEQIGTVGSTGSSEGDHLHLELHCEGKRVAPSDYIAYPTPTSPAPVAEASAPSNSITSSPAPVVEAEAAAKSFTSVNISTLALAELPAEAAALTCEDALSCPLDHYRYISCKYGTYGHTGTDFAAETGTPVYAVGAGYVLAADYDQTYGNFVLLYLGSGYTVLYAQLDSLTVAAGQMVAQSAQLGTVGSTGSSTGPHLHLGLYVDGEATDPLELINA